MSAHVLVKFGFSLLSVGGVGCASSGIGSGCNTDVDCGAGLVCTGGTCVGGRPTVCHGAADCAPGQACQGEVCLAGCESAACQPGQTCNRVSHLCVQVLGGSGGSSTGTTSSGSTTSAGSSSSSTSGGSTTGGHCSPDTWANFAGTWFNDWCSQCHGQATDPTWPQTDGSVYSRIQSGSMPRGGSPPSGEVQRILTWINCGAP